MLSELRKTVPFRFGSLTGCGWLRRCSWWQDGEDEFSMTRPLHCWPVKKFPVELSLQCIWWRGVKCGEWFCDWECGSSSACGM